MNCRFLVILTMLTAPSREFAADPPMTARQAAKASVENLPMSGKVPPSKFLRISFAKGVLNEDFVMELPDQDSAQRVEVEGTRGIWSVRKRYLGNASDLVYITVNRYDFDAPPDGFWMVTSTISPGSLTISGTQGDNSNGTRVRLTQSKGTLSFNCWKLKQGAQKAVVEATAPTIRQLLTAHPNEMREYLSPVLYMLTGKNLLRPGAADVYRLFESIQPDPKVSKELDQILAKLESDSFEERVEAGKLLMGKGREFVLAAVRRDPSDLSAGARGRLDQFIAENSTEQWEDLPAARLDRSVLLDCLDDEDVAVRKASKAELEKVLGKGIEFDVGLEGEKREKAIDALRGG